MIETCPSLFSNVHIHDNNGKRDEHLELGEGNIDFGAVVNMLDGYTGNFVIEVKTACMESAARSRDLLRKILDG